MPDRWPHSEVPEELEALCRAASRTSTTLRLGRDFASVVEAALLSATPTPSLLDAVPPLAQFAVAEYPAETGALADALGEIRRQLPWLGFFSPRRLSIDADDDFRSIQLTGETRVLIAPDVRSLTVFRSSRPTDPILGIALDDHGDLRVEHLARTKAFAVTWRDKPIRRHSEFDALHDLIVLRSVLASARLADEDVDDPKRVIPTLTQAILQPPDREKRSAVPDRETVEVPLLRYFIRHGDAADAFSPEIRRAIHWLAPQFDGLAVPRAPSRRANSAPSRHANRGPFRAVVYPTQSRDAITFETQPSPGLFMARDAGSPWRVVLDDCKRHGLGVSEPVTISVPGPERCCRYRDFSQGVVEVIWSHPDVQAAEARLPMVYLKGDRDFALGSGYFSTPGGASLRVDLGMLSSLLGRRGELEIAAVWKPKEPEAGVGADAATPRGNE